MTHEPETIGSLLARARDAQDPARRYALLLEAEQLAPDDLEVQRALLLHGRLHERDGRRLDFSVIQCYLFHVFEHPEQHDEAAQERSARALLEEPRLLRCLTLAPDPKAFLNDYLTELAGEYVRIFILPDRTHAPWAFGLALPNRRGRYMARPAADVIRNLFSCPWYTMAQQRLTARAFYQAYYRAMDGDVQALDELLGGDLCRKLA